LVTNLSFSLTFYHVNHALVNHLKRVFLWAQQSFLCYVLFQSLMAIHIQQVDLTDLD